MNEHRDALSIKLWYYRGFRVDPEKVCNRANKKIESMITCAHGTRTKACHGQVYLCFFDESGQLETHARYYWDSMTSEEMRVRLVQRSNSIEEQSFHFYSPSSRWNSTLSTRKAQRKEATFTNTRGFYWSNSLEKDSPSNIDAKEIRLWSGSSRKFLHFSFPFCFGRWVILKPENWTILFSFVSGNFFEMYTFLFYLLFLNSSTPSILYFIYLISLRKKGKEIIIKK